MSEVLSQSEIDNLLYELAMGDGKPSDDKTGDAEMKVRPYDFKTANRISEGADAHDPYRDAELCAASDELLHRRPPKCL